MSQKRLVFKWIVKICAILYLLSCNVEAYWANNLTLINWINSQNLTWKAGVNYIRIPHRVTSRMPKRIQGPRFQPRSIKIPRTFDSRLHWKNCRNIISRIRDQGECGSCWAVAGASMLSDRICIGTNASTKVHLSSEDLVTCCSHCLADKEKICEGGEPYRGVQYWVQHGLVTGGELKSKQGCKPYSNDLHKGKDVLCEERCTNKAYSKSYKKDKHKGKSSYVVDSKPIYIMREIFTNGPVLALLNVYADFDHYAEGVYRHVSGDSSEAHSVKIIGWGKESGVKYWLVANSYGTGWARSKGYFKIVRGENHCKIEDYVVAGSMSELSDARETIAKSFGNCANKRSLFFGKRCLLYAVCIWILKDVL